MKTIALLAVLCFPVFALAHVSLDHALPAVGASVKASPKEVKVWFDGPVGVAKSHVDVTGSDGRALASGPLHGDEKDKTVLIVPITDASGKVTVTWSAYCPDCDHTTQGSYTFTVAPLSR